MQIAIWTAGVVALVLWALTIGVVMFPPGDNTDARALSEMTAVVPGILAAISSLVWVVLMLIAK